MKPHRIRIKAGEFVLNVELTRELGARTNKQIREDSERFWASFDRLMKSPSMGLGVLRNGEPLDYSTASRSQHLNHVHLDRDES